MTYQAWFEKHQEAKKAIIQKLTSDPAEYFRFDNLARTEVDFCPLFATKTPCHTLENLNCFYCACPYFRFDDTAKLASWCDINAPEGKQVEYGGQVHQDCSGCTLPHGEAFVKKYSV